MSPLHLMYLKQNILAQEKEIDGQVYFFYNLTLKKERDRSKSSD